MVSYKKEGELFQIFIELNLKKPKLKDNVKAVLTFNTLLKYITSNSTEDYLQ